MAKVDTPAYIKKITISQLKPGMYVHDLNCGWMDHPFLTNQFPVKDESAISTIRKLGLRELYIDTSKGLDASDAQTEQEVSQEISQTMEAIANEATLPLPVSLEQEISRARSLHKEANLITKNMLNDIRLGKQIEMEKMEPVVEGMIDSIFRNPDALLPLGRLKEHDNYTFEHSVSVCTLMIAFSRALNLPRDNIKEIALGALLHDVGKAKVPDEILNKPAKLTDAEFDKMKSHVVQSIIILQNTPGISQTMLDVAGQHHERFDGTGYPNKLKGHEISFHGQMAAIVDVYDAITSNRVYHKGMPAPAAMAKLLEWSKFHFNPDLVRIFIKAVGIYPTGSLVRLESGRLGIVLEQNQEKMLQPTIKAFYSTKSQHYLVPENIDLSKPSCHDRIVGYEAFETWGIDPAKWLPS